MSDRPSVDHAEPVMLNEYPRGSRFASESKSRRAHMFRLLPISALLLVSAPLVCTDSQFHWWALHSSTSALCCIELFIVLTNIAHQCTGEGPKGWEAWRPTSLGCRSLQPPVYISIGLPRVPLREVGLCDDWHAWVHLTYSSGVVGIPSNKRRM